MKIQSLLHSFIIVIIIYFFLRQELSHLRSFPLTFLSNKV